MSKSGSRTRGRILLAAALLMGTAVGTAHATHFRSAHINWHGLAGNTVEFTIQGSWRRNATPSFNPCINVATNTTKPCSGSDGFAIAGDVIREDIGDTRFDPGDGSGLIGSPGVGLYYLVTSADPANNWLFGLALDPASLPAVDTTIQHTYPGVGPYTAAIDSCCRISPTSGTNAHINNPDQDYRVETQVRPGTGNHSPVTALPPIVTCPQNGICTFTVPATDADGDPITFRLATAAEAGAGFTQPGPTDAPNAASINPTTGVYTWNTTGATLAGSGLNTLYSTQVIIEERTAGGVLKGKVAVDFFIQLVVNTGVPPVFNSPVCGSTLSVVSGQTANFTVTATDADPGQTVTLNGAGIPGGATMLPLLPTTGNPVSSVFNWVPQVADAGSRIVTFTATDNTGKSALCSITIEVASSCGNGTVDPSAGEQCDGTSCCNATTCQFSTNGTSCSDGNLCTQTDSCQNGTCTGSNPVTCAAPDQCHNPGICSPGTGTCTYAPKTNGTSCTDGNACTLADTCQGGTCTAGSPLSCAPLDQCHVAGTCNPANGVCTNPLKANGSSCSDGNACTQADSCQAGACVSGTPVTCSASDQCHLAGTCDPESGSCSNPSKTDGTSCTDGNACTQSDTCQAGTCTPGTPTTCAPLDQCHDAGTCNPSNGTCSNPIKANGSGCSDGNACTQADTCQSGSCTSGTPVTCTASDQCHDAGTCDPQNGVCSDPPKVDGTSCDNPGNLCLQTNTCQAGVCTGTNPITCAPIDQCHTAGTCNPGTGTCSQPVKPNGSGCDDGNACSQTDTCQGGACTGSNPVTCNASDQCHLAGTCDPDTGLCSNPPRADGTGCNDGNACTLTDVCAAGVCSGGTPVTCAPLDQCHTAGTCNTGTGICSNPVKPTGTPCSDGNACSQTDSCQSGTCVGSNPVTCPAPDQCHLLGACDPETGTCSDPVRDNGTACNDGDACTVTDRCTSGACVGSNPVVCSASDQCHGVGVCDHGTGVCSNPALPNGTTCTDGNACTVTDTCQSGTCTPSAPIQCVALDVCHQAGVCNTATGVCSNPIQDNGTECGPPGLCRGASLCSLGVCIPALTQDADGDGVCDNVDDCPLVVNPGQSDIDGDGTGDDCDDSDVPNSMLKARLSGSKSPTGTGRIALRGEILVLPPTTFDTALGITARVQDTQGLDLLPVDLSYTWPPANCVVSSSGNSFKCKDALRRRIAVFKRIRGTLEVVKYRIKFVKTPDLAPFKAPFRLTITRGIIDWQGTIDECVASPSGSSCRQL